jgi:hypothetical protein
MLLLSGLPRQMEGFLPGAALKNTATLGLTL